MTSGVIDPEARFSYARVYRNIPVPLRRDEHVRSRIIAKAYIDTWNETDEAKRLALLQQHWTRDASYADPLMSAENAQQVSGLVGAVHQRFPGFRFKSLGTPNGHGPYVRLSWSLGPEGAEPPIEGSDVVRVEGGRIHQVIGFIDRAPA